MPPIIDHTRVKLGKREPRIDRRTLLMHRYLLPSIPPPPPQVDWSRGFNINWGMMLNGPNDGSTGVPTDGLGDCTEAAKGHAIQTLTLNNGRMVTVPDSVVLSAYESECGYVLGQSATDQGGVELDVLNDWRQNGFGGHKLLAYVATAPGDIQHVQQGIFLFGGLYMGVALPLTAQGAALWDLIPDNGTGNAAPGSWGLHAMWVPGYNSIGPFSITWGMRQQMTWAFAATYWDEAYPLVVQDWLNSSDVAPSLINLAGLEQDLSLVTN